MRGLVDRIDDVAIQLVGAGREHAHIKDEVFFTGLNVSRNLHAAHADVVHHTTDVGGIDTDCAGGHREVALYRELRQRELHNRTIECRWLCRFRTTKGKHQHKNNGDERHDTSSNDDAQAFAALLLEVTLFPT